MTVDRYRFLTYKCRRWLPCNGDEFHTHHLALIIPPLLRRNR